MTKRPLSRKSVLKRSHNARKLKKMLGNIPLLPENRIVEGFTSIEDFAQEKRFINPFADLFSYFERYWLKQVRFGFHSSIDPIICIIHSWINYNNLPKNERNNISVADLNMPTTSSVEAVNSLIQRSFPKKTNIFKFIEHLKLFESIKSTDLYQLAQGEITSQKLERKRAEDKQRENRIIVCSDKLKNGDISVVEFLKLV